ncbi:MAG TPA: hypothetical protein VN222_14290 [Novosphingobium sp.]|nr:hypothetical protein [Novosphingobium sp.]
MATVNGVETAPTVYGQIVGTGNGDHISGGSGNDVLYGTGGNDVYYGGGGNDTFVITESALSLSSSTTNGYAAQAVIYDFGGAGGWSATDNDFIRLVGFGTTAQGTTLAFDHYGAFADGTTDVTKQYYTIHDALNGNDYTIYVHSLDGAQLKLGDYNFY